MTSVLVTGMPGAAGPDPHLGAFHELLTQAVRDSGFEAHQVPPQGLEDLSSYDVALVGLAPPLDCMQWFFPTLEAVVQARRTGLPFIIFADGWRFADLMLELGALRDDWHGHRRLAEASVAGHRWAVRNGSCVQEALEQLVDYVWPGIVRLFPWSDRSVLLRSRGASAAIAEVAEARLLRSVRDSELAALASNETAVVCSRRWPREETRFDVECLVRSVARGRRVVPAR
jgi:hypothetical protein